MDTIHEQDMKSVSLAGNPPRIALIGCGAIAEAYYLPALAKHQSVLNSLTLVDRNIDQARKLAESFDCRRCLTDYREILDEIDGVIVALPTHLHHPVSMEFLSRGVPVLCEKPLAESANKAREMVDLADRMGTKLATNYSRRLWSQFAKVKEIIMRRSLGEPVSIKYSLGAVFNWPTVSGFYFNSAGSGRGVLLDLGSHVLDHICWWLGGKPKIISSQNDSFGGGEAVAHVEFSYKKCTGEVKLSWLSSIPCRFVVAFEGGSIEGDVYYPQYVLLTTLEGRQKRIRLKSESWSAIGFKIVDNFVRVISKAEKPLVPGFDVLDSMIMIDECYATATRFRMPWYEIPEMNHDR